MENINQLDDSLFECICNIECLQTQVALLSNIVDGGALPAEFATTGFMLLSKQVDEIHHQLQMIATLIPETKRLNAIDAFTGERIHIPTCRRN